jgi:hypothetical protein
LLPAPTAPSEGSAGVRNLVDRCFRPTDPLSILAHQLRRRVPPNRSLLRGARPIYLTAPPEGSLVFRPFRPGVWNRGPSKPKPSSVLRPFLGRPLSRPASLFRTEMLRAASRWRKIDSSGASSRLAPARTRKLLPLPAGGDRTLVACRARLPLPAPGEAGTASRSHEAQCTPRPSRGSEKCELDPVESVDIGQNRRNLSHCSDCGQRRLPFRSPPLTSEACPNPPPSPTSRRTCKA